MKIQNKMTLYAVGTLILLACIISFIIWFQMEKLKDEQNRVIRDAYIADKEQELINYINIAKKAIEHLYEIDNDIVAQEEAKKILTNLRYGIPEGDSAEQSGYYFGYTLADGIPIIHPIRKDWVTDAKSKLSYFACKGNSNNEDCSEGDKIYIIRDLIHKAQTKEGFLEYPFVNPAQGINRPKLSYVEILEKWDWMLGTGIYIDEINTTLSKIEKQNKTHLENSLALIVITTIIGLFVIGWTQNRLGQTIVFNKFTTDLHSGVCYKLYETIDYINENKETPNQSTLENVQEKIWSASEELWSLMDRKNDSSRLKNRLQTLAVEYSLMHHIPVDLSSTGNIKSVAWEIEDELYKVAQEALLNIRKHAEATKIIIILEGDKDRIELFVKDNGIGFDISIVNQEGGLSYMRECMRKIGGTFDIETSPQGTVLAATAPKF